MRLQDSFLIFAILFLFAMVGCDGSPNNLTHEIPEASTPAEGPIREIEITERELEVIRFVLNSNDDHPVDRIYFLTTSPMSNWGERGQWESLSPEFHTSIENLQTKFHSANEAYLADGHVLEKSTDRSGWMQWVTIKRWISPTEVEVERGIWCCPLGGGASAVIYEKTDGEWKFKKLGAGWIS